MGPQLTVYYNTKSANIHKGPMMLRFRAFALGGTTLGTTSRTSQKSAHVDAAPRNGSTKASR